MDKDLKYNASGYFDPTAYEAIKKVYVEKHDESSRFFSLLNTIKYIVRLADFEIEGRIVLKDRKTGKVWR